MWRKTVTLATTALVAAGVLEAQQHRHGQTADTASAQAGACRQILMPVQREKAMKQQLCMASMNMHGTGQR